MNSNQPSAQRPSDRGVPRQEEVPDRTPNPDMQPEDAGTAESGNADAGRNPTEPAMKQTSKTPKESNS